MWTGQKETTSVPDSWRGGFFLLSHPSVHSLGFTKEIFLPSSIHCIVIYTYTYTQTCTCTCTYTDIRNIVLTSRVPVTQCKEEPAWGNRPLHSLPTCLQVFNLWHLTITQSFLLQMVNLTKDFPFRGGGKDTGKAASHLGKSSGKNKENDIQVP